MQDVLIPDKRGGLSGIFSNIQSRMNIMDMGMKGQSAVGSFKGMFSKSPASVSSGGGGAGSATPAAAAPLMTESTTGATFGDKIVAGGSQAAQYAPYAVPVAASGYEYSQAKDDPTYSSRSRQLGPTDSMGRAGEAWNRFTEPVRSLALTDDRPSKMDAIDRRYNSQQDAKQKIQEAKAALNSSGLSLAERRSIGQKLERANMKLGDKKRGSTSLYT